MALCINNSGTYRNILTLCINQSGTYRNVTTGCINQSGTYRLFGFFNIATSPLGSAGCGGFLICRGSNIVFVVAPSSAEVGRNWYSREDANTRAQEVTGCTGWFVPSVGQLQNPGYTGRTYWDSYSASKYWSTGSFTGRYQGQYVNLSDGSTSLGPKQSMGQGNLVRAFRCVTY